MLSSGRTPGYERQPELAALTRRSCTSEDVQLALRLAAEAPATVLLIGDLTPANILDGGEQRTRGHAPRAHASGLRPEFAKREPPVRSRSPSLARMIGGRPSGDG